jgi:C4-dicarboxylate-specific signal transduction histidine kinase
MRTEIEKREKAESEKMVLHHQLMTVARKAGMADVSSSILHNVGNSLNGITVSIGVLNEQLQNSKINQLSAISDLLKKNRHQLQYFLTEDPKGKLIPQYFIELGNHINKDLSAFKSELISLDDKMIYVLNVIKSQQLISSYSGVTESLHVQELINSAFQMCGNVFEINNIEIIQNFDDVEFLSDRHKILQILINIFLNANDAIMAIDTSKRMIEINVIKNDNSLQINVSDTGIGIDSNDITKIFSFGFTTKPAGHGFGLHSSALAATELRGSLVAESEGLYKGAKFILTLPMEYHKRK